MKVEHKVGLLFVVSIGVLVLLAFGMGLITPWSNSKTLFVMYNYAGGIDEGSPVRVMGIKVGKVKSIRFDPSHQMPNGEQVKLKIEVQIESKAWTSIRKDSKFFINLAGVIGEKFLEISPGNIESSEFSDSEIVRGEDPPRIDQLISQGYGLAGKILELVERNEGSVTKTIAELNQLVTSFNKTLVLLDRTSQNPDVSRLLKNVVKMSDDLVALTGQLRSQKSEETFDLVQRLLRRLEPLDGPMIRKFLQEEGVRARIF